MTTIYIFIKNDPLIPNNKNFRQSWVDDKVKKEKGILPPQRREFLEQDSSQENSKLYFSKLPTIHIDEYICIVGSFEK